MNKFCIKILSYNNEKWAKKNIESALNQDYSDFYIMYVNDCSQDKTEDIANNYLDNPKFKYFSNKERLGIAHNHWYFSNLVPDNYIIVNLDGDDWFPHSNVLHRLNDEYNRGALMTYGSFEDDKGNPGCSIQIPDIVHELNKTRRYRWCSSHLRTYRSDLFKKIDKLDFMLNEEKFMPMAADLAYMFPLLEMAGKKAHYISDILYIYNTENPISEHQVNRTEQIRSENLIRARIPYTPL